jgi:serine/threonine protein kinase/WD40 repeat protein
MSTNPANVRSIFNEVVDLQPTERAAALGRLCGDDTALRAELDALLASHDAAHVGNFMTSPTAATTIRSAAITEAPGSRVGPYKLLQVIGEGGFGTVFLAEQSEPVRRRVALKIIKLGMDTKQVIARFEAERQALALMDHPHIARVLDAGATPITEHGGGRPYFVMEYVVGDAITQFAANNNLDIRARLELFAQVCSAVQHAHTKGIIHRDIKPGNVLVTMTDGKPFARVIDFGIAKATSSAAGLTDKTLFTEHRQLIGTPEYMSPEQAQGSPDIDTRTDVYALGVLLYELLAGDTPFDGKRLRSAAWDEMRRIIKEEDPPTPSARVTQRMKIGGSASSPSAPSPLRPSAPIPPCPSVPSDLRGELDWIVMKSLDKDRARRYETPSALAADVMRHLQGEAVQAATPSAAYRLRKFVRRNKGPVIVGSTVVIAILAGTAIAFVGWREASALARAQQEDQERAAAKVAATFSQIFNTDVPWHMKPQPGLWMSVTANLDRETRITRAMTPDGPAKVTSVTRDGKEQVPPLADSLDALSYVSALAISGLDTTNKELQNSNEQLRAQTDAAEWSAYTANLALAQAAMDAGNWPEARERLRECPESKRGWEWRFTDLLSQSTIMHAAQCNRGITSPDGTRIAFWSSGGNDIRNEVYVRPIDNPREVVTLQWLGDWGVIRTVAWSPDGKRLLATSSDDTCHIINADGSGAARTLQAGERCARFAAWSPNGSHILTLSTEGEIRVWDTDEPTAPRTVKQGVQCAAWSPDGRRIAATMPDGSVVVLNAGGSGETVIHHHDQPAQWSLAWSPDGEWIVVYSNLNNDSRVFVIRADGASEPRVVSGGRGAVQDAAWSPDGSSLIIGFHRGPAMIMRVDAPHEPLILSGHSDGVSSVTWSRDGARAFTSSWDGICVWDAATGSLVGRAITEPSDDSWTMSSTLGSTLVASNFSAYHFGSYEAMSKLIVLDAWGGPDLRFHEQFWELPLSLYVDALMSSVREAPVTGRTVTTPDGSRRIEADGRVVRFIDAKADRELAVLRTTAHVTHLTMTGDGTRLILHHADLPARVWDIRDPEERRAEMVRAWAERTPAGAYLDTLLAGPTPTTELENAVISDASLTPLRRLVAAELLLERLAHIDRAASTTFESIIRDAEKATDSITMVDTKAIKAHITAAAAALQPSDALPPRAIEKVIAQAESWEYRPSTPPAEERLAQERLDRQLAEAKRISDAADEEPILRNMIRQALADQIELLGIDDPAVPLTLSRFGAFCYTHGLSLSPSDWPTAQRIVAAWRANPRASQPDLARAFAGAAAIAVDAGEFKSAAELFAELALLPADAREGLTPYFSVWLCLPSGVWEGEVTEQQVRSRAIAAFADSLVGWHEQLERRPDSETRHIRELLDWLEGIPAYREPLSMEIARLRQRLQDLTRERE